MDASARAAAPIAVFGAGSFGTAMATLAARNGHPTRMLVRRQEVADSINQHHRNPRYFSEFELPELLTATLDPAEALKDVKFIVHCVPMQASQEFLHNLRDMIPEDVPIVSTSKGLHSETLDLMSDVIPKAFGRAQPMAFMSGPTFAKELLQQMPTGFVVASTDAKLADQVREVFASEHLRVYPTDDIIGVQVGGALKNIFAIACGIVDGLGLGANTTAMLVTLGCREAARLAGALGARPETLNGLSGIGDLMLTCYGALSRNRTVGVRLGKGETLEEIIATSLEVAEGVATTPAAVRLSKEHECYTPMIDVMGEILAGRLTAKEAGAVLMALPVTSQG